MRIFLCVVLIFLMSSCINDIDEVNDVFDKSALNMERLKNVEILYSDSARVEVSVRGKKMNRILDRGNIKEEFPSGIIVNFMNSSGDSGSKLTADYAMRYEKSKKVITKGNVILVNSNKDKLMSPELIWNEESGIISTDKIIKITRPSTGDTIMGIGIKTDKDFKRFEIMNRFSAKLNVNSIMNNPEKPKNEE